MQEPIYTSGSGRRAVQVLQELYIEGAVGWDRFKDPEGYLQARRHMEQWLHEAFIAKEGRPVELKRRFGTTNGCWNLRRLARIPLVSATQTPIHRSKNKKSSNFLEDQVSPAAWQS